MAGNSMLPLSREIAIENMPEAGRLKRAIIHLDDTPYVKGEEITVDGNVRMTNMRYSVCYAPWFWHTRGGLPSRATWKKDYQVFCDMWIPKGLTRWHSWEEFRDSDDPVARWLIANTDVGRADFRIARANRFLQVPFSVRYEKLRKKLGTMSLTGWRNKATWKGEPGGNVDPGGGVEATHMGREDVPWRTVAGKPRRTKP